MKEFSFSIARTAMSLTLAWLLAQPLAASAAGPPAAKPGDPQVLCITEHPVVAEGGTVTLKAWAASNGQAVNAPRFDWKADAGRIEGTGPDVRWDLSSVKADGALPVRKVTATVKTPVTQETCAVEVIVGPKEAARRAGKIRGVGEEESLISAREFLLPDGREAEGFGLYSYILFSTPPKDAEEKARYLKTIQSCLVQLQDVDEYLNRHVRPKMLNATYIPVRSRPSQGKSDEEWAANVLAAYDYAEAQILLNKVNHRHVNGPYLVSVLTPLTQAAAPVTPPANVTHLWEDLTGVAPEQAWDWIRLFTYLAAQQRSWTEESLDLFTLRLRNLIAVGGKITPKAGTALAQLIEYVKG